MSTPKHTPGPWQHEIGRNDISYLGFPDGGGIPLGLSKDDADLIAAAPDLYEVAITAPILSKYHGQHGFDVERFIADYESWSVKRLAAVAKADG